MFMLVHWKHTKILRLACHCLNLNKGSLSVEIHLGNPNLEIILLNMWHMDVPLAWP